MRSGSIVSPSAPDGTRIATGSWDNTIKLWDSATGAEVRTLRGHRGFVQGVAFNTDGTLLASVSEDQAVKLWEVATGREQVTYHGHTDVVHAVAFDSKGRWFATAGADAVILWNVQPSRPVVFRGHPSPIFAMAFRRDGQRVVTWDDGYGSENAMTKAWDPTTGRGRSGPALPGSALAHRGQARISAASGGRGSIA